MSKLEAIKDKLKEKIISVLESKTGKIYLEIAPNDVLPAAKTLFKDLGLRFVTATGIDSRKNIEIIYHFTDDSTGDVISLRTFIKDKKNPAIDSLAPLFRGAEWIEREMHELLGINFKGHPKLKHLLLADDWPKDSFPLRHDNER